VAEPSATMVHFSGREDRTRAAWHPRGCGGILSGQLKYAGAGMVRDGKCVPWRVEGELPGMKSNLYIRLSLTCSQMSKSTMDKLNWQQSNDKHGE